MKPPPLPNVLPYSVLELREASIFDEGYNRRKRKKKKCSKSKHKHSHAKKYDHDSDWSEGKKFTENSIGTKKLKKKKKTWVTKETEAVKSSGDNEPELGEKKERIRKKKKISEDFMDTDKAVKAATAAQATKETKKRKWKPKKKLPDFVPRSIRYAMERLLKGVEHIEDMEKRKAERDELRKVKRQVKIDEMLKKRKSLQMKSKIVFETHGQNKWGEGDTSKDDKSEVLKYLNAPPSNAPVPLRAPNVLRPPIPPKQTRPRQPTALHMKNAQKLMRTLPKVSFNSREGLVRKLEEGTLASSLGGAFRIEHKVGEPPTLVKCEPNEIAGLYDKLEPGELVPSSSIKTEPGEVVSTSLAKPRPRSYRPSSRLKKEPTSYYPPQQSTEPSVVFPKLEPGVAAEDENEFVSTSFAEGEPGNHRSLKTTGNPQQLSQYISQLLAPAKVEPGEYVPSGATATETFTRSMSVKTEPGELVTSSEPARFHPSARQYESGQYASPNQRPSSVNRNWPEPIVKREPGEYVLDEIDPPAYIIPREHAVKAEPGEVDPATNIPYNVIYPQPTVPRKQYQNTRVKQETVSATNPVNSNTFSSYPSANEWRQNQAPVTSNGWMPSNNTNTTSSPWPGLWSNGPNKRPAPKAKAPAVRNQRKPKVTKPPVKNHSTAATASFLTVNGSVTSSSTAPEIWGINFVPVPDGAINSVPTASRSQQRLTAVPKPITSHYATGHSQYGTAAVYPTSSSNPSSVLAQNQYTSTPQYPSQTRSAYHSPQSTQYGAAHCSTPAIMPSHQNGYPAAPYAAPPASTGVTLPPFSAVLRQHQVLPATPAQVYFSPFESQFSKFIANRTPHPKF